MQNKNKPGKEKKKGKKELSITLAMLSVLFIGALTLSGCGGCLSCLCPGCDGNPDLPDEAVPAIVLAMDYKSCMAQCLSCFGCHILEYSESDMASCMGCYDATYYGCSSCGANVNNMNLATLNINASKIFCSSCYCVNISDSNQVYTQGYLIK